ncbi:WD domain-containing protein, G-beta repeat-containing protein [Parafrankia irregularis]|uniref:WD domain-containing protein, G-beta repeat-containing protein n=2 Tax=Frankiaceae TaxID=74712 RepID=A0A0S4QP15_9ACTN|nr:serine/threonine protein kinase [Parafrankia sp. CH37]CUU57060.1 WD domain-containing protein, G-beta repeat-containing protein [Parafrankia irregularis]
MTMSSSTSPDPPADPAEVGRYRLVRRLGAGGMGTVHLGVDHAGRQVAVKLIRTDLASRPEFRERLKQEADSARRVARFCTAAVLDVDVTGDVPYLVTEFVDGPTLAGSVRARGPLSHSELHLLAASMATALMAIHRAGIVHRDLKPGNIVLSRLGPKVIDFGIARALDTAVFSSRDQAVGTPAFMAPEQARSGLITPAADVFAWGGVLVYAATGHHPFGTGPAATLLRRVVNDEPALDGFEDSLRPLVEDAMRKNPQERPTAEQLYARLLDLRHTESEPPVGPPLAEVTVLIEPVTPRTPGTAATPVDAVTHSLSPPAHTSTSTAATVMVPPDSADPEPAIPARPAAAEIVETHPTVIPSTPPAGTGPERREPERREPVRPKPGGKPTGRAGRAGRAGIGRRGARALAAILAVVVAAVVLVALSRSGESPPADTPAQVAARTLRLQVENRPLARRLALASYQASPDSPATRSAMIGLFAADLDPLAVPLGSRVLSAALRPDGRLLAAGTEAGTIELWAVGGGADPAGLTHADTITNVGDWVYSVAFHPNGSVLAAGVGNGQVRLWDLANPARPKALATMRFHQDRVRSIAFAPDGQVLASGGDDGQIALWTVADPSNPTRVWAADGATAGIRAVAFSPRGRLLAFGGNDGTVRLWDATDPARPTARPALRGGESGGGGGGRTLQAVAFSPDGSALAAGGIDGSVQLWGVRSAEAVDLGSTAGGLGGVTSVGFDQDGGILATAGEDDIVRLTDVSSPARPVPLTGLRGHTKAVNAVVLTPDGRTVLSASGDGSVRVWTIDPAALARNACADPANQISTGEWREHFGSLRFEPPCA